MAVLAVAYPGYTLLIHAAQTIMESEKKVRAREEMTLVKNQTSL
jgi:hypothetical protein